MFFSMLLVLFLPGYTYNIKEICTFVLVPWDMWHEGKKAPKSLRIKNLPL